MNGEIEPIPAEQARAILEQAIRDRLGEGWEDEADGWVRVTGHDYMARLNKGKINLDFQVDLLGHVTVEKREINVGQDTGRFLAWALLGLSLIIAYLIAEITGFI